MFRTFGTTGKCPKNKQKTFNFKITVTLYKKVAVFVFCEENHLNFKDKNCII